MKRALLTLAVLLAPAIAFAQDTPKVGVTMAAPMSIGVLWKVSDRFAIRPDVTFSITSDESASSDATTTTSRTTTDGTTTGVALSGLLYVGRWDALRTYVAPRVSYSRNTSSGSTGNAGSIGASTSESSSSSYGAGGSFGAEYTLGRRFGVFGEAGLTYLHTTGSTSATFTALVTSITNGVLTQSTRLQTVGANVRSNTVGTRAAVGVIVFF